MSLIGRVCFTVLAQPSFRTPLSDGNRSDSLRDPEQFRCVQRHGQEVMALKSSSRASREWTFDPVRRHVQSLRQPASSNIRRVRYSLRKPV